MSRNTQTGCTESAGAAEMRGVKAALARCAASVAASPQRADLAHEVRAIEAAVDAFLVKHCLHEVVSDYVDITPDRGQYISYCRLCLCTLDQERLPPRV